MHWTIAVEAETEPDFRRRRLPLNDRSAEARAFVPLDGGPVHRLETGAARASVRYECAILNAALHVGEKKLGRRIAFKNLPDDQSNIRKGFFDDGELAALVLHLPPDVADLIRFLYMTGWRRSEGCQLMWSAIEWDDADYPGEHHEPCPASMRSSGRVMANMRQTFRRMHNGRVVKLLCTNSGPVAQSVRAVDS